MKRTTTIVLFASIFAVTMGTLSLSGDSNMFLMTSAVPHTQDNFGILGHVEYKVMNADGDIVKYKQGDNLVVNDGEDCAADAIFGNGVCVGTIGTNYFDYIGIGNGTSGTVGAGNTTLADANDTDGIGTCATDSVLGEMARRQVTPTHDNSTGAMVVTLDTAGIPFTFDASNATIVYDSGLFNADYTASPGDDTCGGNDEASVDFDMFARQLLNDENGITVNDGDSLSVKWTVTVGTT